MNFIGLDLGTGAVKGVLWDGERIVAEKSVEVEFVREGDAVEIDAGGYRESVLGLIRGLAAAGDSPVAGIAMCAASGNTLVTDADGTPRTRIVSWLDNRKEPSPDPDIHEIVGWPWPQGFPFAHLLRMRRETPELFAPGFRVCMNNDWIQFVLCGDFALDHSSATPYYLQDQKNFRYYRPYLEKLGLNEGQLSRLVPSGTVIGTLRPVLAFGNLTTGTRIVAGSFDHPSGARACGIVNEDEMLLSCGTSWVGFRPARERRIVPGTLADPYMIHEGGNWGEIRSWGKVGLELEAWIVEHYTDSPERYRRFSDDALATDGPARAKMIDTVTRFRAKAFPETRFSRIVLAGGPSESPAWRKFLAETWDCKIELSPYKKYTGAVGAAMLAKKGSEK
jgi:sugar (pentulose or hexulose) kinase